MFIFPEHDLEDGDLIKLGQTVLQVSIYIPNYCVDCSMEIPENQRDKSFVRENVFLCESCRKKDEKIKRTGPIQARKKVCVLCGRDATGEMGQRHGDFACSACRQDPLKIIKLLMMKADKGDKNLPAIKGYSIVRELGHGGMGAVYLARHTVSGHEVALKIMLPQVAVDKRAQEAFLREARITKVLKHPNVVQLFDSGCSDGTFFFTLEYCDGGSIDKLLEKHGGKLGIELAVKIALQALGGLHYAHNVTVTSKTQEGKFVQQKGLVHRDMKPANLFLSNTGSKPVVKIADLGLAKAFKSAGLSGLTATGSAAGSPWYMSKQQVINFKYAKPEVDVWGLAATLYHMLTGYFPRDFPKDRDPWLVVLQDPPVPIRQRNPSIPARLAEVIDSALIDTPAITFTSAADLKRELEKAL